MKRVERHHIKEDGLAVYMGKAARFLKAHEKELRTVALGLVAILVLALAVMTVRGQLRARDNRVLTNILALSADLESKPENAGKLEQLAGPSGARRLAHLELATYWIEKGDLAKAEAALKKIGSGGRDMLAYQARDLQGQIEIKRKAYDRAIALYKAIEAEKPSSYPLDAVLFRLAQAHELKGDKKDALDLYKKVQTDYPGTYYGYEASMKASRLGTA